jgi:hypothetical protein
MIVSKMSIIAGGLLSLCIVLFHSQFYKLFNWSKDFDKISLKNQKILYTVHMALLLLFLGITILSLVYAEELSQATGLAFGLVCMYSLFWLWRLIWQIVYFRPPKNSSIQKMPALHYFSIGIFVLLFVAYSIPIGLRVFGLL